MINPKRLVNTFLDLVKIDSPSGEEKNIAIFVSKKLTDLGGNVISDSYGNLITKFPGNGKSFLLSSHLDTVEPGRKIIPKIYGDKVESDGTTILGGDAKAGIAIILEALQSLVEDKKSHVPLEIVFTLEEETGLLGATNLDYSQINATKGIVLDAVGGVENLILSAPGYTRIDAEITGRGAHSGFEPEKGISAIKIASVIISRLNIGRIDAETTANVGTIRGGSARNAIAETAYLEAEIRSSNVEKLREQTQFFEETINNVLLDYPGAKVNLEMITEFEPYKIEKNHPVIHQLIENVH